MRWCAVGEFLEGVGGMATDNRWAAAVMALSTLVFTDWRALVMRIPVVIIRVIMSNMAKKR